MIPDPALFHHSFLLALLSDFDGHIQDVADSQARKSCRIGCIVLCSKIKVGQDTDRLGCIG